MAKNSPTNEGDIREGVHPSLGKITWKMAWEPTPVFLPGELHEERSLAGYSPRGLKETDRTE